MVFSLLKLNVAVTDDSFNSIYPDRIQKLANKHWTSVEVAKQASDFLADQPGTRVLDIGSGVGKFCMVGASYTQGYFIGVEQRNDLIDISETIAERHNIRNVKFIHSNITSIDFSNYDAFYFYNPFYENIALYGQIDDKIPADNGLFDLYCIYTYGQFHALPAGTRLVTYHASSEVIPATFKLIYSLNGGLLKFWQKAM